MRDGWVETTLGAVAALRGSKADPSSLDPAHPYVGLEHLETGYPRVRAWGQAGEMSSLVSIFEEGDTLFGRLRPYLRKVALAEFAGVCTSEILVLTPDRGAVLPAFLHLLASAESTIDMCVARSAGSRMPRTSAADLLAFPIALPPLAEQRRIVDLIAALDESVARGTRLIEIAEEALASFLRFSFGNNGYDAVPVDHLLVRNIGGVWGAEPGADEVDVRVYRSTEFTRIGHLVESGGVTRAITRRQLDSRQLLQGDILLEKSGGGPNQPVGRVVRVKEVPDRSICANFVQLITADASKVDPGYLFYALFARHQLGVTEQYQRRTTGIRNLQTKEYLALTVGVPPVAEQRRVVMTADAFDDLRASAENAVERLRVLRQGLIADLLSGAHEIPESYDALLDMTA